MVEINTQGVCKWCENNIQVNDLHFHNSNMNRLRYTYVICQKCKYHNLVGVSADWLVDKEEVKK